MMYSKSRKTPVNWKGHREQFEDGVYFCQGSYGNNKDTAAEMAEGIAKR
jgi:hypothetical protein